MTLSGSPRQARAGGSRFCGRRALHAAGRGAGAMWRALRAGRRGIHLVAAIGLAVVVSGCGLYQVSASDALNRGRADFLAGHPQRAIERLRQAVRERPGSAIAHVWRGIAAETLGELEEARDAYERAVALWPSADHRYRAARLAWRMGDTGAALVEMETVLDVPSPIGEPVVARVLRRAGPWLMPDPARDPEEVFLALVGAGRLDRARVLADRQGWRVEGGDHCTRAVPGVSARTASLLALVEHPHHAPCLYGLGVLLAWDGAANLARRALEAYIAQADDPADAEAAAMFLRAHVPAHEVPPVAESYHATGERLRTALGLPDEALAVFERASRADPRLSWAPRSIGTVWEARHDLEQALAWHRKAVELDGDDVKALRHLGALAARTLRWDESLAVHQRAIALAPDNAQAHAGAGRALLAVGREREAVVAMLRAAELDPDLDEPRDVLDARLGPDARWGPTPWWARRGDPGGHRAHAARLARTGRLEHALVDARGSGASVDSLLRLGALAEFAGQLDDARAALERARSLAPDAGDVVVEAAALAVRVGDDAEAHALLDRALDVVPWPLAWVQPRLPAHVSRSLLHLEPMLEHAVQLKIDLLLEEARFEDARALAQRWGIVETGVNQCGRARRALTSATYPAAEVFTPLREALLAQPLAGDCLWWLGQWLTDAGWVRMGRVVVEEAARVNRAAARGTAGAGYLRARLSAGRPVARRAEQLAILGRQRWVRGGDATGARALLQEAVHLDPGFVRPYVHLARIASDRGELTAAARWLEQAIAVDVDAWRAHRNLGEVLGLLERHADAETRLRRALELFPHDAGARLQLARALWAQGRYDEYAAETRHVLDAAPAWTRHLAPIQTFLETFERTGAPRGLPPVADPPMYVDWLFD